MSAVALSSAVTDDTPRESLRIIAPDGATPETLNALAVAEDGAGALVLVKARAARPATDTRPARPASWTRTSRLADFARALTDGLIAADV